MNLQKHPSVFLTLVLALFCMSGPAKSQESQTSFTPYLWASGQSGEVATLPGTGPVEIDVDFSTILENLDLALMGVLEHRKGDYGFFGDFLYIDLDTDEIDTPGPAFSDAKYDQQLFIVTAAGFRRWDTENGFIDLLAGVRYWDVDNSVRFGAAAAPTIKVDGQEDWMDFIVGVKGRNQINSKWSVNGWLIAGGGDSDSTVDILGGVNYTLGNGVILSGGYRHLTVDYEEDGFLYDTEFSGPIFGATFFF